MPDSQPLFTIVVPTRNRPADLDRALASIAEQTFGDFEVLVVDDGSDPEPAAAARASVARLGERFRLVRREPGSGRHGPNAARNAGIEQATGRYLGFLDDDDYWCRPDHLAVASTCLEAEPVDVYVANQIARRGDETIVSPWLPHLDRLAASAPPVAGSDAVRIRREDLLRPEGIGFVHVNMTLARRDLVASTGGFWEPVPYEGDLDFFFRLVDAATTFLYRSSTVSVNTVRAADAEPGVSSLDATSKLLLRVLACQHAELACTRDETRRYARLLQGGAHKTMAKRAHESGDVRLASACARRAVAADPSVRWWLIAIGLRLRSALLG